MTPLEAATRLSGSGWDLVGRCPWCGRLRGSPDLNLKGHKPDCPYLSMPRIVAALEAAEALRIVNSLMLGATYQVLPSTALVPEGGCRICHHFLRDGGEHDPACDVPAFEKYSEALVAALRGEGELG